MLPSTEASCDCSAVTASEIHRCWCLFQQCEELVARNKFRRRIVSAAAESENDPALKIRCRRSAAVLDCGVDSGQT